LTSETQRHRKRLRISKHRRQQIFARDKNRCADCRRSFPVDQLTIDHIIPISKGGGVKSKNLQAMCQPCNVAKGDRFPIAARSGGLA
jgi:5-methylcytosine-specific restriction endonuclease McrA